MSALYKTTYDSESNVAWRPIEVCWLRYGGGADAGKYHVFTIGICTFFGVLSLQCVVDDFGDLVAVGERS